MLKDEIDNLFNDYENTLVDCLDFVLREDVPFKIGFIIDSTWYIVFPEWVFTTLPQKMELFVDSETISESRVKDGKLVLFLRIGQCKNKVQLEIPVNDINSIEIPGTDVSIRTPIQEKISHFGRESQLNLRESSMSYLEEIHSPLKEGLVDVS